MTTTLTTTTRTLAVWSHGGFCELGRVECGQPATHRLTTGAGDWLVCAECAEGELVRDGTLVVGAVEVPVGGRYDLDAGRMVFPAVMSGCGFDEAAGW